MRRTFVTPAITLVLLGFPDVARAQVPALPAHALEQLPAGVRIELERAYAAVRARPEDASAAGRLAMTLHAYDQLDLARAAYRAARDLDPRSVAWAHLSGIVQAELGDHTAAAEAFGRARQIDPEFLPAWLRFAESLMKAGELERSREEFRAILTRFPELALAHYGLGQVLAALGDPRGASDHHSRAVALMPQFGPAHYALALAYRDSGREGEAQPHLAAHQKFGSARPALPDPFLDQVRSMKGTARDLIAEATRLDRSGRLQESIAMHERALEADPAAAQAHVNLISLYGRAGQPARAKAHYKAAVAAGANLADAHYNYGVLMAAQGRHQEAAAAFRRTLEVNPFHAQAHNNLGGMLARDGKLEEAAAHFRQAIANDPQHRGARFNLARLLTVSGDHQGAIEQLQKLVDSDHADTPRYTFALAQAHHRAGDIENARRYAEQARRGAERQGQTELASAITKALQQMAQVP